MQKPDNYDSIPVVGDYEVLEPGGYICKIVNAKEEKSQSGRDMLVIDFDIAEGEHKDIYQRRYDVLKKASNSPDDMPKWPNNGVHRIMINDSEGNFNKFLKTFITSVEQSNNFDFWGKNKGEAKGLKGKLFGGIFGEEEYEKNDGKIGTSTKLQWIRATSTIEDGKYQIPEKKTISKKPGSIFDDVEAKDDDDLPF